MTRKIDKSSRADSQNQSLDQEIAENPNNQSQELDSEEDDVEIVEHFKPSKPYQQIMQEMIETHEFMKDCVKQIDECNEEMAYENENVANYLKYLELKMGLDKKPEDGEDVDSPMLKPHSEEESNNESAENL